MGRPVCVLVGGGVLAGPAADVRSRRSRKRALTALRDRHVSSAMPRSTIPHPTHHRARAAHPMGGKVGMGGERGRRSTGAESTREPAKAATRRQESKRNTPAFSREYAEENKVEGGDAANTAVGAERRERMLQSSVLARTPKPVAWEVVRKAPTTVDARTVGERSSVQ